MNLPQLPRSVWLLGGVALLLPIASGTIVALAEGRVAQNKSAIERLSSEERGRSDELRRLAAASPDPAETALLAASLEQRRSDAAKPAIVVAELSAACNRAGVRVEAIRPLGAGQGAPPTANDATASGPVGCELDLRADCATLARLLDDLSDGRLPVRVTAVTIEADEQGPEQPFGMLRAEVMVEAYRPRPQAKKEARP